MKDMKTVIIAVLCGVIAGLALILKKAAGYPDGSGA